MMALIDLCFLLLDEMKIKKIWFLLNTVSFNGFFDLGDTDINALNFGKKEDFATHTLVYFVRGVFSNSKYSS